MLIDLSHNKGYQLTPIRALEVISNKSKFLKYNKKTQKFNEESQVLSNQSKDTEAIAVANDESLSSLFDLWLSKSSGVLITLNS